MDEYEKMGDPSYLPEWRKNTPVEKDTEKKEEEKDDNMLLGMVVGGTIF